MKEPARRVYEFGPFRLEPTERRLFCQDQIVPLTPKAHDLLTVFVEQSGHLIDKETLLKAVWEESFVEEANLAYTVSALRKALGDTSEPHRYIATVPKRGYRFIAPVVEVEALATSVPAPTPLTTLVGRTAEDALGHDECRVRVRGEG